MADWRINNSCQVQNKRTGEIVQFGLNGQMYIDDTFSTSASFTVVITNISIAQKIIRSSGTQYDKDTILVEGDELVLRNLPMNEMGQMRELLDVPDLDYQLAMANRK